VTKLETVEKSQTHAQLGRAVHQNNKTSREGLLERGFSRMFRGLVYAQIWEDPVADMGALNIQPGEDIVCIASGGCNMMSYLIAQPGSVSAVDLSPAHVALGRLKIAGAQILSDHATFYRFFGEANSRSNEALYHEIAPSLDADTRGFWEGRRGRGRRYHMFTRNIYRQGALGRFIAAAHMIAKVRSVNFEKFLDCKSMEEQVAFFDQKVAPLFDHRLTRFLTRQRASLFGLGIPPAQYEKLAADEGGDVTRVLKERTRKLMCDFPLKENYFAWAAFYLEAQHFDTVAAMAPRASVVNRSLTDMLAGDDEQSKDIYVLLDAQDWMSDLQLNALWDEITRTARPGARVLFRTGGTPDILPGRVRASTLAKWSYDAAASAKAFAEDRSAIYGGVHLYRKQT